MYYGAGVYINKSRRTYPRGISAITLISNRALAYDFAIYISVTIVNS